MPDDLDQLQVAIDNEQELADRIVVNERAVADYRAKKQRFDDLTRDLQQAEGELAERREEIEVFKALPWVGGCFVTDVVNRESRDRGKASCRRLLSMLIPPFRASLRLYLSPVKFPSPSPPLNTISSCGVSALRFSSARVTNSLCFL